MNFDKMMNYRQNKTFVEFARFFIVGVLATGIDATLFYVGKIFLPYQVALVIGYLVSLIVNYYLTTKWTFKIKQTLYNLVGIIAVHLFNLFILRMGLMSLFVQSMKMDTNMAYIPMLGISVIFSFFAVKIIIKKI